MNAVGGEEVGDRGVEKLGSVVGLHSNKRPGKLCAYISNKVK